MSTTIEAEVGQEFPASGGHSTIEVTVSPVSKERTTQRQVVLLVDASSSMDRPISGYGDSDSDSKMDWARTGVLSVLDELNHDDFVSIVSFDTSPEVHMEMTRWGDADRQDMRNLVRDSSDYNSEIRASGGTDIYDALTEAQSQFVELSQEQVVSQDVVLLSDGRDSRDLDDFEDLATDMSENNISISAGGIGENYKQEVLLALTKNSGGKPDHIEGGDDIETFLEDRVREAGDTIAVNPDLRVTLNNSFMIDESEEIVFSTPSRQTVPVSFSGDDLVISLPDKLVVGEDHRLSFTVLGTPNQTGISYPMADLELRDDGNETIATTSVEARYADEPRTKERVEKDREAAKISAEISDRDVEKQRVRDQIEKLKVEYGWTDTAEKLLTELEESENTGGKIRASNSDDTDD